MSGNWRHILGIGGSAMMVINLLSTMLGRRSFAKKEGNEASN